MAIAKFHTLEDLKATGLPMFMGTVSPTVEIGDVYLQDSVISQWDFKDYEPYYTYFEDGIHFVVRIAKQIDSRESQTAYLDKDLSNLDHFGS